MWWGVLLWSWLWSCGVERTGFVAVLFCQYSYSKDRTNPFPLHSFRSLLCHFSVTSPNLLSVGKLQFDIQFPFAIGVNCWDLYIYIYVLGSKPWFLLLKSIITLQSWGLEGPRGACPWRLTVFYREDWRWHLGFESCPFHFQRSTFRQWRWVAISRSSVQSSKRTSPPIRKRYTSYIEAVKHWESPRWVQLYCFVQGFTPRLPWILETSGFWILESSIVHHPQSPLGMGSDLFPVAAVA